MNHFTPNVIMLNKDLLDKEPCLLFTELTKMVTNHIARHIFFAHAYQKNHDHYYDIEN